MEKIELLRDSDVFSTLSDDELFQIEKITTERNYDKESIILEENLYNIGLFIVIKGSVQLIKENKLITTLCNGDCFGEIALFDQAPHSCTVKSSDESVLLEIKKSDFDEFIEKDPKIGLKILKQILKILSFRLRQTNEQVINLVAWNIQEQFK